MLTQAGPREETEGLWGKSHACHSHFSHIMLEVRTETPDTCQTMTQEGALTRTHGATVCHALCASAPSLTAGRCSVLAVHSLQHSQPCCACRLPSSSLQALDPAPFAQLRPVRCLLPSAPCLPQELVLQDLPGQPALQGWDLPALGASAPTAHRKLPARNREQAARHGHAVCPAMQCTASSMVPMQAPDKPSCAGMPLAWCCPCA